MTKRRATVPLGELLRRSQITVAVDSDAVYREITVKLWGKGVIARGEVMGAQIAGSRRFLAQSGQFILSRIDARNGASGVVPPELDQAVVTNDFPLFDIDRSQIEPGYLAWLSKTAQFVELCSQASEGTTNRVRLQEARFLASKIPLPSLPEQRALISRLDTLAAHIRDVRSLQQDLAGEAEAFIVSVHHHLAGTRIVRLGTVLQLHEISVPVFATSSYPQVGLKSFGGGLFPKAALTGAETTYRAFNRLFEGAFVLSQVKGWEGAVAICPRELDGWFVSPEYRTFRCIEGQARPSYLRALVRTEWFWSKLQDATRGVGARRERTRPDQFLALSIPMPDDKRQSEGEVIFAEIDKFKRLRVEATVEINALMPSLVSKAFEQRI